MSEIIFELLLAPIFDLMEGDIYQRKQLSKFYFILSVIVLILLCYSMIWFIHDLLMQKSFIQAGLCFFVFFIISFKLIYNIRNFIINRRKNSAQS